MRALLVVAAWTVLLPIGLLVASFAVALVAIVAVCAGVAWAVCEAVRCVR